MKRKPLLSDEDRATLARIETEFKRIPEALWTIGAFYDEGDRARRCALGHCGDKPGTGTKDGSVLRRAILNHFGVGVVAINDGHEPPGDFPGVTDQPTPKGRILGALAEILREGAGNE